MRKEKGINTVVNTSEYELVLVDTGAGTSCCDNLNDLNNPVKLNKTYKTAGGDTKATHVGSCSFVFKDINNKFIHVEIDDTKHIPNCGGKILSSGYMKRLDIAQTDTLNNMLILSNGTKIPLVDQDDVLYVKCFKPSNDSELLKPVQIQTRQKTAEFSDTALIHTCVSATWHQNI